MTYDLLEGHQPGQVAGYAVEGYYFCQITEVNGEYEYTSAFLMKCDKGEDPDKRFTSIFLNYRGSGNLESEGEDFVWYDSGTAARDPNMIEIPPGHFEVMQNYMTVL